MADLSRKFTLYFVMYFVPVIFVVQKTHQNFLHREKSGPRKKVPGTRGYIPGAYMSEVRSIPVYIGIAMESKREGYHFTHKKSPVSSFAISI